MSEFARCLGCQARTRLRALIVNNRCPRCRPEPSSGGSFLPMAAVFAAFLVAYPKLQAPQDQQVGVWLAVLVAYRPVALIAHELTHALAAVLVGWRVHEVCLGHGQELFRTRVRNTDFVVGTQVFWGGGHCVATPSGVPPAWRIAVFASAPLLFHLAIGAATLRAAELGTALGDALYLVGLASLFDFVQNAWPRRIATNDGTTLSDGGWLWRLRREPRTIRQGFARQRVARDCAALVQGGDTPAAIERVRAACARSPDDRPLSGLLGTLLLDVNDPEALDRAEDIAALFEDDFGDPARNLLTTGDMFGADLAAYWYGSILVSLDRLDEVVELSEQRVEQADGEVMRALWEACLALALVLRGRGGADLVYAEGAAKRAYEAMPWVPYVTDAAGMTLVELGRHGDGLNVFHAARTYGDEPSGMRLAWTYVACAARGEHERAKELHTQLEQGDHWPAVSRRIAAVEL